MEIPLKRKVIGIYPVPLGLISGNLVLDQPHQLPLNSEKIMSAKGSDRRNIPLQRNINLFGKGNFFKALRRLWGNVFACISVR